MFSPKKLLKIWLPLLFVSLTGGLLILIIFATLTFQLVYLDRVYPGVQVGNVEVGGLTPTEAKRALENYTTAELSRPVTVQVGTTQHQFTGQELGIRVNVQTTVDLAYAVGRSGNMFRDVATHLHLLSYPEQVEPVIWYDAEPTQRVIETLAAGIDRPARDASLSLEADGQVTLIPAQNGLRLHLEATRSAIETSLFAGSTLPSVAMVQEIIPATTDADLEVVYQQAKSLLSAPLVFGYSNGDVSKKWQILPETLVTLMRIEETVDDTGKTRYSLAFDMEKFGPYFERFAKEIEQEPVEAHIAFDPETEKLIALTPSQDGLRLDTGAAYRQLQAILTSGQPVNYVGLPTIIDPPQISSDNLAKLGIESLVSEATTYFKGSSQGRMNNIEVAAQRFDGIIIPPDGIFSFNEHLGEVTKDNGYDESLIIYGNRTTVGIGGGVCQVSTTVFRAALFGGFELVERWAHGYRVGWYEVQSEPGLDATIYSPSVDFRFRNDTGHHLLIHTDTDLELGTITFRFYGTPSEREVIVEKPVIGTVTKHGDPIYEPDPSLPKGTVEQVDWAKDGMEVTVTRVVSEAGQILHRDEIVSRYKPWTAVFKVGTGGDEVAQRAP